jgi:hypothetical protein
MHNVGGFHCILNGASGKESGNVVSMAIAWGMLWGVLVAKGF